MSDTQSAITLERCSACAQTHAVARGFCPTCGGREIVRSAPSGAGRVFSITVVHRAPTAELQAEAPYAIALVDLAEGCRIMARAPPGTKIGDAVRLAAKRNDGALVVDRA